jgi:hypothetical protein
VLKAAYVGVSADAVLALGEGCPLLEHADVRGSDVGDTEITALVRGCPELKSLAITATAVTAVGLRAIREHCKKLVDIDLTTAMFPGGQFDETFFPRKVSVGLDP